MPGPLLPNQGSSCLCCVISGHPLFWPPIKRVFPADQMMDGHIYTYFGKKTQQVTLLGIRLIWTLVSICFSKSQVTVVPLGPGRAAGTLRGPSRVPEGASDLRVPAFLQCLPLQTGLCHPWLQLPGQYPALPLCLPPGKPPSVFVEGPLGCRSYGPEDRLLWLPFFDGFPCVRHCPSCFTCMTLFNSPKSQQWALLSTFYR